MASTARVKKNQSFHFIPTCNTHYQHTRKIVHTRVLSQHCMVCMYRPFGSSGLLASLRNWNGLSIMSINKNETWARVLFRKQTESDDEQTTYLCLSLFFHHHDAVL